MPCLLETHPIGGTVAEHWFCCNCSVGGPLNLTIDSHCPHCGHQQCPSLRSSKYAQLPGSTRRQPVQDTIQAEPSIEVSSAHQLGIASDVLGVHHRRSHYGPPNSVLATNHHSENETIDPLLISSSLSKHRTPIITQLEPSIHLQSSSGRGSSLCGRNKRHPSRDSRGKQRRPIKKKRPLNATESQESCINDEDETSNGILFAYTNRDTSQMDDCIYACPFLVINVQRYRHFKTQSCYQPWTMPKLREHVIGRSKPEEPRHGPHTLHVCEVCFEGFLGEKDLEMHTCVNPHLTHACYPLPAEGVGKSLSDQIAELPKGPKSGKRTEEYEATWNEWYRVLNGEGAPPQSCYFTNAIARCNDPDTLEDSKTQLIRTFQRAIPIELKAEALRCYIESHRIAVLISLKPRIDIGQLEQACDILSIPMTGSSKKKLRSTKLKREKVESISHEAVMAHDGLDAFTTEQGPLVLFEMGPEIDHTPSAVDTSLQETLFRGPWAMPETIDHTVFQSREEYLYRMTQSEWPFSSWDTTAPAYPVEWDEMSTTIQAGPGGPGIPYVVQPELAQGNSQHFPPPGRPDFVEGSRKPALLPHELSYTVMQPMYTSRWGTFERDLLNPHDGPSFDHDPRPPLSTEFEFDESLFNLTD
ncbi:hypothetical protein BU23DRAFT_663208 [Bimuria novae-zelandiae CBS 107.79]|uniref:Uncharacterized protein n=1 Tax=Bimuria novae-zelandiae CBS 107.79 TaxID=1447943 RepID=A0A6A5UNE4_9PLEO|nr:hypothetical protein BU23DRAFT_663208 [Bimuria novae-zelandiae CBS 107.79]